MCTLIRTLSFCNVINYFLTFPSRSLGKKTVIYSFIIVSSASSQVPGIQVGAHKCLRKKVRKEKEEGAGRVGAIT